MPSGLDAMAALGNDEAVRLLEPELNAPQIRVEPARGTAGGGRREAGGVAQRPRTTNGSRPFGRSTTRRPRRISPRSCGARPGGASNFERRSARGRNCATIRFSTANNPTRPLPCANTRRASSSHTRSSSRLSELTTALADRIAAADAAHDNPDVAELRNSLKGEAVLYFVSTKDKIDPAALQRMEKKIDHSIHLLESLT